MNVVVVVVIVVIITTLNILKCINTIMVIITTLIDTILIDIGSPASFNLKKLRVQRRLPQQHIIPPATATGMLFDPTTTSAAAAAAGATTKTTRWVMLLLQSLSLRLLRFKTMVNIVVLPRMMLKNL